MNGRLAAGGWREVYAAEAGGAGILAGILRVYELGYPGPFIETAKRRQLLALTLPAARGGPPGLLRWAERMASTAAARVRVPLRQALVGCGSGGLNAVQPL